MVDYHHLTNSEAIEQAERGVFNLPGLRQWIASIADPPVLPKEKTEERPGFISKAKPKPIVIPTSQAINFVLREAAARDQLDVVELLIEHTKANPYEDEIYREDDRKGATAFDRAAKGGPKVLRYLVEKAFEDIGNDGKRWHVRHHDLPLITDDGPSLMDYARQVPDSGEWLARVSSQAAVGRNRPKF